MVSMTAVTLNWEMLEDDISRKCELKRLAEGVFSKHEIGGGFRYSETWDKSATRKTSG